MPSLADLMTEDRREKLARELTHSGTYDNDAARSRAWKEIKSAPGQLAQGAFTGLAGAPVEIANMALRPFGLGSGRPVGGMASLASLIRADEGSVPYQAGTMLPIGPEGLAMGAKAFLPAMAAALGGTAIASKASKGAKLSDLARALAKERGIFAGVNAKNADLALLEEAKKMKEAGVPDAEIWARTGEMAKQKWTDTHKPTGWTFGFHDKKPRFEIPDDKAFYRGSQAAGSSYAEDVMLHPELYVNYPSSGSIRINESADNIGGSYSNVGREQITLGNRDASSTALHELQHAIQQREGFARGGSPDTSKLQYDLTGNLIDPYQEYKRLAGEAEARLTQARMNMTPEQRLANYPVSQFDVPVDQQIVRYGDGQAMSLPAKIKVFHGSENEFDVFDPSKAKTAQHIYTTEYASDAGQYGKVSQFEANAKNPVDLSGEITGKQLNDLEDAARNAGLIDENMPFNDWYEQVFQNGQMYQYYGNQSAQNALMSEMYAKGYDAIKIPDAGFGGSMSSSWVFEDPSILKKVK